MSHVSKQEKPEFSIARVISLGRRAEEVSRMKYRCERGEGKERQN